MAPRRHSAVLLWPLVLLIAGGRVAAAPAATTYDQKQQGEYNIQLHLKDIQILALLSNSDMFDGDYDYEYDYAEITLKPPTHESLWPVSSTSPQVPIVSSTSVKPPSASSESHPSTQKAPPALESSTSTTSADSAAAANSGTNISSESQASDEAASKPSEVTGGSSGDNADKQSQGGGIIPVGLKVKSGLEAMLDESHTHKHSVSIVADDERDDTDTAKPSGDIVPRKCAIGYTRDHKGRCRRVRRPAVQLPFGMSRLANLVSQLRHEQPPFRNLHSEPPRPNEPGAA